MFVYRFTVSMDSAIVCHINPYVLPCPTSCAWSLEKEKEHEHDDFDFR
jgi:hypothetical protein